jgi:hypothetical protein
VVIVDAVQLLPVSDTRALLDLLNGDGVLMVARSFSTRSDQPASRISTGSGVDGSTYQRKRQHEGRLSRGSRALRSRG